jgi:hypothetical protein
MFSQPMDDEQPIPGEQTALYRLAPRLPFAQALARRFAHSPIRRFADTGAGWDLYFFLLSPDKLSGARRFFVQIAIPQKVSEDRNVASNIASRQKKWFHHYRTLVINFTQSSKNLRPRHPAFSGGAPIALTQMKMTEPFAGPQD